MRLGLFLACAFLALGPLRGAVWQWSVAAPPPDSWEESRAFLWIPETCERVRGVVFGHHNMEEEALLEHPEFRRALADLGFAAVWVAPTFDRNFRFDQGAGERFETLLRQLGELSGYGELSAVPVVPVGHSAAASMPWYFAAWRPERILAGISFSGQWPYVPDPQHAPHVAGINIDFVPGLVTLGEYEWADDRMRDGLRVRATHPMLPLSGLGLPADGHFLMTDEKVAFIALYLRKAVTARLRETSTRPGDSTLRPIDPTREGWLAERYRRERDPSAPAAPVGEFAGDCAEAFWWFDGELARAAEALQRARRGRAALLGYVQNDIVLPQDKNRHEQVLIPWQPGPDGITFRLSAAFLDTVPEGRPERWTGLPAGAAAPRPGPGGPGVEIRRITGPVRHLGGDTWELAHNRATLLQDRRGNEAWLAAVWPGDDVFKRSIQQARVNIPRAHREGEAQTIAFDLPTSVTYGPRELALAATATSGLPVRYFVREGPAEIVGDGTLRFTRLPPRARFPVAATVVAWQFGRATEPRFRTADPVERTVLIQR